MWLGQNEKEPLSKSLNLLLASMVLCVFTLKSLSIRLVKPIEVGDDAQCHRSSGFD